MQSSDGTDGAVLGRLDASESALAHAEVAIETLLRNGEAAPDSIADGILALGRSEALAYEHVRRLLDVVREHRDPHEEWEDMRSAVLDAERALRFHLQGASVGEPRRFGGLIPVCPACGLSECTDPVLRMRLHREDAETVRALIASRDEAQMRAFELSHVLDADPGGWSLTELLEHAAGVIENSSAAQNFAALPGRLRAVAQAAKQS